jgi:beta-lactamase regulating signal transducer with metallopeptidase domain
MSKKLYFSYILIGSFYTISKLIYHFVSNFAGIHAIIYGIITGGLTVCAGILALKEFNKKYKNASKPVGHWLAVLLPLIIIPLTPLTMQREQGAQWLLGDRLIMFVIFEIIAIAQVILAVLMFRGIMRKRDRSVEP